MASEQAATSAKVGPQPATVMSHPAASGATTRPAFAASAWPPETEPKTEAGTYVC